MKTIPYVPKQRMQIDVRDTIETKCVRIIVAALYSPPGPLLRSIRSRGVLLDLWHQRLPLLLLLCAHAPAGSLTRLHFLPAARTPLAYQRRGGAGGWSEGGGCDRQGAYKRLTVCLVWLWFVSRKRMEARGRWLQSSHDLQQHVKLAYKAYDRLQRCGSLWWTGIDICEKSNSMARRN